MIKLMRYRAIISVENEKFQKKKKADEDYQKKINSAIK